MHAFQGVERGRVLTRNGSGRMQPLRCGISLSAVRGEMISFGTNFHEVIG
jgi:hypothetical protein